MLLITNTPVADYILGDSSHAEITALDDLDPVSRTHSLVDLAVVLFGDLSYLLVLSVLGIILAMVGPVKLAYQDYVQSS